MLCSKAPACETAMKNTNERNRTMTTEITTENFDAEVTKSALPVVIDFWASWCGPCRMLSPMVDELASQYAGKIKVGKVNVDEQPRLAMNYDVQSIPTLIFFKDGKPVDKSIGVVPKEKLEKIIESL